MQEKEYAKELQRISKQQREDGASVMANFQTGIEQRLAEFEAKHGKVDSSIKAIVKDSSRKAYMHEFQKVVDAADVILEVLDARDPLTTRCRDVEQLILAKGSGKRIILVLNKIDLVPREVVEAWLKYLRNEFPTIAFKASTQSQSTHLARSVVPVSLASNGLLQSNECLGADSLIRLLKNYCRNANIKTNITVGVVGYPNVGKSSIINSLKREKACHVGANPGVTKNIQEVVLDKNVRLIDSPGIVFSSGKDSGDLLLSNSVELKHLHDPTLAIDAILKRCEKEAMMLHYSLPAFADVNEFLLLMAQKLGKLKKGGVPDVMGAAMAVLNDWNRGKIRFYTRPPVTQLAPAKIVGNWSAEFNLDEVLDKESKDVLDSLASFDLQGRNAADEDDAAGQAPEAMEVDAKPMQKVIIASSGRKTKKARSNESDEDSTPDGPQLNRDLRLSAKKRKQQDKRAKKRADAGLEAVTMANPNEDYDFSTDFTPLAVAADDGESLHLRSFF